MRLTRLTPAQWARLVAHHRTIDLAGTPARAEINAIEIELATIERAEAVRNGALPAPRQ